MFNSQRGAILLAATALVALLAVSAAYFLMPARTIAGQVIDGATGQPLAGAVVKTDGREFRVGVDGSFSLPGLRFGSTVAAEARGYLPASRVVALGNQIPLALTPRVLEGVARDALADKPVAGVRVAAGTLIAQTDEQGRFKLIGLEPGTEVVASAIGYVRLTLQYEGQPTAVLALKPNVLEVKAIDQYTKQPVEGAEVTDGRSSARTDPQGQARLQYLPEGAEVTVRKGDFALVKVAFTGQETAEALLRPNTVAGFVKDPRGRPVVGASVSDGNATVSTDETGAFKLSGVPENARLGVSANGYERRQMDLGQQTSVEITLKPFAAKGLYLTYYGVGSDELTNHVLQLADTTEINAVVIDVKGDRGWIAYRSSVPMVQEIGAQQQVMISDPKSFLADLKKRGIYTIARIVVFKDNPLATSRPDLAVINANTGRPWVDNEGLRWADPTRQEVWDYNIALATEAIELGFDEVQWDYVRFPTDASPGNSLSSITFSKPNTMENRMAAINGFLERAKRAIKARGGNVSADIFGYVVWREDDMGIGQKLEELVKHLDYVSPMVYPNLFWDGIPMEGGAKYTNQKSGLYPYEIVYESMRIAAKRIGAEKLRPWLQYYDDYLTGKRYAAAEVEAQKRATYENGIAGWLFWDPTNKFNKGGFAAE